MTIRPPDDRSLPEPGASVRSEDALDVTNGAFGAPADDTPSPSEGPAVIVSYQQFMERRGLRRRMSEALARLDRKHTLDGEVVGSVTVDLGKPRDEI